MVPAQIALLHDQRYCDGHFVNPRNQKLFYCAAFPPPTVSVRSVVLFLHGIGEHSLRFTHVYRHLCLNGYGVIAYDMLGHGQSACEEPGLRAHGSEFHFFVDDTNDFITTAKLDVYNKMLPERARDPPLVIMGISFGALVALNTILSGVHPFNGCIVASPAIAVEYTPTLHIVELVLKPLVWLLPTTRLVAGVNFKGLTRDPDFLANYMADPLNVTDNLTTLMAVQVGSGMKQLQNSEQVEDQTSMLSRVPLLVLQGTEDKVTSVPIVKNFVSRAAIKDKELKLFPGLFHCLWNEPEKQQVMDYASNWLNNRFVKPVVEFGAGQTSLGISKI
uniref:Serine aminopeptidase S33 domain-containing protein n=1 Tax=Peronospora matthiolae TaxID=2874970 RepID=A0AAV1TLL6_9STRA